MVANHSANTSTAKPSPILPGHFKCEGGDAKGDQSKYIKLHNTWSCFENGT
jgi:hypothetical protein